MPRALRWLPGVLLALVLLPIAFVYVLYFVGARNIPPEFAPTQATYPDVARRALWRSLRGTGEPEADPMSPLGFVMRIADIAARMNDPPRPLSPPAHLLAGRVARHVELTHPSTQGNRHLTEIAASIQASRWPIDRQLDTVLDGLYFAEGHRGIEAGARRIFGKDAAKLSDTEADLLLDVSHGPTYLDPWCQRDRLRGRLIRDARPDELDAAFAAIVPMPADHAPCAAGTR